MLTVVSVGLYEEGSAPQDGADCHHDSTSKFVIYVRFPRLQTSTLPLKLAVAVLLCCFFMLYLVATGAVVVQTIRLVVNSLFVRKDVLETILLISVFKCSIYHLTCLLYLSFYRAFKPDFFFLSMPRRTNAKGRLLSQPIDQSIDIRSRDGWVEGAATFHSILSSHSILQKNYC